MLAEAAFENLYFLLGSPFLPLDWMDALTRYLNIASPLFPRKK